MKKLLRFLMILALVVAVVWATRDWLLPKPQPPVANPPPFRHPQRPPEPASVAPQPAAAPTEQPAPEPAGDAEDDLKRVKGIGPVYERKLHEAGVTTFAALIGSDSEQLASRLDVSVAAVVSWKTQATEFLG